MNKNIFWLYTLSILIYFGQGVSGLPGMAFSLYLKETLNLDQQKIMYIGSLIGLAWCIKPFWGFLVDNCGVSKKFWILVSAFISLILTTTLGFVSSLPIIIGTMMMLSLSGAVRDVANDAAMCIEGKKHRITGKIQSLQWISITIASVLTGITGGWIAEHWNYQTAYLILVPFYIFMLVVAWNYKENIINIASNGSFISIMKELFTDKNLLLVCAFLFLYNFSPSIGTPLFFIQRDEFKWSATFLGLLGTIGSIASIFGAWLYYHFSKQIDIKIWLRRGVYIGAICTLCYLFYTPVTAIIYDVIFSVISMFLTLMVLDFMARESKHGFEAISFALLCSVTNLTSTLNGFIGGYLFPIVGLKWLILISAGCTFLCLPLIKRLKI